MSLVVQAQIRRNAEEVRAYLEDLLDWEQSFEKCGGTPKYKQDSSPQKYAQEKGPQQHQQQQQPQSLPETKLASDTSSEKPDTSQSSKSAKDVSIPSKPALPESRKKYARDLNSLPDYYKAWDAYDPDAEEEAEPHRPGTNSSSSEKTQRSKAKSVRHDAPHEVSHGPTKVQYQQASHEYLALRRLAEASSSAPGADWHVSNELSFSGLQGDQADSTSKSVCVNVHVWLQPIARTIRRGPQDSAGGQRDARMRICASVAPPSVLVAESPASASALPGLEGLNALKKRGNAYFAAGRYAEAVQCYTEALQQAEAESSQNGAATAAPALADVLAGQLYGNRGTAFYYLKKYDKCIADCTAALQKQPQNPKALHRRGLAWSLKGEAGKAVQDLQLALQLLKEESQKQHEQQALASEGVPSTSQDHERTDSSSSLTSVTTPSISQSSGPPLTEKILQDMNRIRLEAENRERKEMERRKAVLLQPLIGHQGRYPNEPLRPLEVQVMRHVSIAQLHDQQARSLVIQHLAHDVDESSMQEQQDTEGQQQGQQQREDPLTQEAATKAQQLGIRFTQCETPQKQQGQQQRGQHGQEAAIQKEVSNQKQHPEQRQQPESRLAQGEAQKQQQQQQQMESPALVVHPSAALRLSTKEEFGTPETIRSPQAVQEPAASPRCGSEQKPYRVSSKGRPHIPRSYVAFEAQWRSAGATGKDSGEPGCPCGGARAALLLRLGACEALQRALGLIIDPDVFYECLRVLDQAADVLIERQRSAPAGTACSAPMRLSGECEGEQGAQERRAHHEEDQTTNGSGTQVASREAMEVQIRCTSCSVAEFTAAAWGGALQQLLEGPRSAVAAQLGGTPCRMLLGKLKEKAAVLAAAAAPAAAARRCCKVLLLKYEQERAPGRPELQETH